MSDLIGQYGNLERYGTIAGLGSIAGGLFGGGKNPYDAASGHFNQIPKQIKPYLDPYINAGRAALPQLTGEYNNLINNPGAKLNAIGQNYQESPGYQWQKNQALQAATNAQAAGGMAGSGQHQQYAGEIATQLANQDYYNYLSKALGLYGAGLGGLGDINKMGYGASEDMASALYNNQMNQGNLAFAGQAAQNQSKGSQWGDILGGLGTLAAFL